MKKSIADLLIRKAEIEAEIAELTRQVEELCAKAGHKIENSYDSAYCESCDRDFGWYCPDSPDHACHYYTEDGKIKLITGVLVDMPPNHDPTYETDDACIFCGEPDERK